MASPVQEVSKHGYDQERFQTDVSENLRCVICLHVLKDPVMCGGNQHHFCRACITRHLNISHQSCPMCNDPLTVETLQPPTRALLQWLSTLSIRCDNFNRGCQQFISLADLESHAINCAYSPVVCPNEGCDIDLNKQDVEHHVNEVCEYRKVVVKDVASMAKKIEQIDTKIEMYFDSVGREMKCNLTPMKEDLNGVKIQHKMLLDEIKKVNENQATLQAKLGEMEIQITTPSRRMMPDEQEQLSKAKQEENVHATEKKYDVIVAGGYDCNSVEGLYQDTWELLQPMTECRTGASSVVYDGQMLVIGGHSREQYADSIAALPVNPVLESGSWSEFPARLPQGLTGHKTVVWKDTLMVTGGFNGKLRSVNLVQQVQLVPPYETKTLSKMTQGIHSHGAEIRNDDIIISGGTTSGTSRGCVDTVLLYDVANNQRRKLAALPYPVMGMATVLWGNNVILLGGCDRDDKLLSNVVIYSLENGKSYNLPEMSCARECCNAVVVNNCVLVLGGRDANGENLNTVEKFDFRNYSWQEVSPMNKARCWATAVALQ